MSANPDGLVVKRLLIAFGVAILFTLAAILFAARSSHWSVLMKGEPRIDATPTAAGSDHDMSDLSNTSRFFGELSRIDPDLRHRNTAANAEFRMGDLLEKTEPEEALKHFKACTDLLENYLHGWPWFRMGQIQVTRGQMIEADRDFERTMQIDDGRLALRAAYERGKIALNNDHIEQAWVYFYEFLRFSPEPLADYHFLNMLRNDVHPAGLGLYVVGRALLGTGQTEQAGGLLGEYVALYPNDLSGRFYAKQAGVPVSLPVYSPQDVLQGDVRQSSGLHKNSTGLIFYSDGRLMADLYVNGEDLPGSLRAVLQPMTEGFRGRLSVLLNGESVDDFEIAPDPRIEWKREIPFQPGRNLVEIAFQNMGPRGDSGGPILRIESMMLECGGSS
ncbi:MAG TPA: hypothetical protein PK395_06355 [bacterium]|nr:hypothetical protein [bacterium]